MNFSAWLPRATRRRTLRLLESVAMEVAGTIRNSRLYTDARQARLGAHHAERDRRRSPRTFEVKETLGHVAKDHACGCCRAKGARCACGGGRGVLKVVVDEGTAVPASAGRLRSVGEGAGPADPRRQAPALINARGFPSPIRRLPPSGHSFSASPSFPRGSPSGRSATTPPPPGCASTWKGCT